MGVFKLLKVFDFEKKVLFKEFMEIMQENFSHEYNYNNLLFSGNTKEFKLPTNKKYFVENLNLKDKISRILKIYSDSFFLKNVNCTQIFLNEIDFEFAIKLKKGFNKFSHKYFLLRKERLRSSWLKILKSAIENIKMEELIGYKQFSKFALIFLPYKGTFIYFFSEKKI
jgi:hypothetical protein